MLVPDLSAGWAVRENVTAAKLNKYTQDPWNFLRKVPNCVVSRVTAFSPANGAGVAVDWSSGSVAARDTDSMATLSASAGMTIKTAGIYLVTASCKWAANPTGARGVQPTGGTGATGLEAEQWQLAGSAGSDQSWVISTRYFSCPVGSTLTTTVYQTSGGALSCINASLTALWVSVI